VQQKMREGDREKVYEFARRSPGIRLIIISPENKILLTKEYRPELKAWDFRLPGGKVFDSLSQYNAFLKSGDDILVMAAAAARLEAEEEVGLKIENPLHVATSPCGATMRWDLYYFVVSNYTSSAQKLGQGENIETIWLSLDEAQNLALTGQISEDRSAAVLLRYLHSLKGS
jgi:8-oxo-dGTP pyrophosphatase MutT (NUDIX family)